MTKTCRICHFEKPLDEFHRSSSSKDGRQGRCKDCACRLAREWGRNNAVKANATAKARRDRLRGGPPRIATRLIEVDGRPSKICKACEETRPLDHFYRHPQGSGGVANECIKCSTATAYRWGRENLDRFRRNQRRYRYKKEYGLTVSQVDQLVQESEGRCAICLRPDRLLKIDHCHTTGIVRGLLCHSCNTAIGHFVDDIEVMQRAISYLQEVRKTV